MDKFVYDGVSDFGEGKTYYFACEEIDHARKVFFDLYEEDLEEFAAERVDIDTDEYKITGCTIGIEVSSDTESVESTYITVSIETDEGILELEPAYIELDDESIEILMSKIK